MLSTIGVGTVLVVKDFLKKTTTTFSAFKSSEYLDRTFFWTESF